MYLDPTKYQGDMANHERMHLFARDIIRVKNPMQSEFRFKYDSIWFKIGPGQTQDWERYLAYHYVKTFSDYFIGLMIAEQQDQALKTYSKSNPNVLVDPYLKNRMVYDKIPRTDDPQLQRKVVRDIVVGLVSKFGEDRDMPETQVARINKQEPLYKTLLDEFSKVSLEDDAQPEAPIVDETGGKDIVE